MGVSRYSYRSPPPVDKHWRVNICGVIVQSSQRARVPVIGAFNYRQKQFETCDGVSRQCAFNDKARIYFQVQHDILDQHFQDLNNSLQCLFPMREFGLILDLTC